MLTDLRRRRSPILLHSSPIARLSLIELRRQPLEILIIKSLPVRLTLIEGCLYRASKLARLERAIV
jgi:hypothetical protein